MDKIRSQFEELLSSKLQDKPVAEPLQGHELRFETKLIKQREQKRTARLRLRYKYLASIAASVCVMALSVALIKMGKQDNNQMIAEASIEHEMPAELAKVEEFYQEKLEKQIVPIGMQDVNTDRFMASLHYLEAQYALLEKALLVNNDNEKVINAMVENYRYRLQIIEIMQKYLQINKNKSNENKTAL